MRLKLVGHVERVGMHTKLLLRNLTEGNNLAAKGEGMILETVLIRRRVCLCVCMCLDWIQFLGM